MDYQQAFAISAAGMRVERTRVEIASLNLANANTVSSPVAVGFQPLRVLATAGGTFANLVAGDVAASLPLASVEPSPVRPRLVLDPGHPLADERGFVAYPGVDPAAEMVTLMAAARAYEANVAALGTARALALKTLEIGRTP
ncbi:flagellar basal body rod protein FlgC [Ramlibacter sp. USB13]|uniref:Flagellar basal-body rod protein FlgC n=1 Tax=Ramlibacter cellulosilyticus TaxID=2764187 RepID=A0A923SCL7_9BURK|nr:flagellar basal body rod protein FlgC [Ramlibacter cellulosilyticus]